MSSNREKFTYFVNDFENNTYLHGFKKINEVKSTKQRAVFYVLFFGLFLFCAYLIVKQIVSYQKTATHVSGFSYGHPIWVHSFPAVTVCNINVVKKSKTKKIDEILKQKGYNETVRKNFFSNLFKIVLCTNCDPVEVNFENTLFAQIHRDLDRSGYTVPTLMEEVSHDCTTMFNACKWNSRPFTCSEVFKKIKTTAGYCCAFNYFATKEYHGKTENRYYTCTQGARFGLELELNTEEEEYLSPMANFVGFQIVIHNSYDIPMPRLQGHPIKKGEIENFRVGVSNYVSESDVKYLTKRQRKCVYDHEDALLIEHKSYGGFIIDENGNGKANGKALAMFGDISFIGYHSRSFSKHSRSFPVGFPVPVLVNYEPAISTKKQKLEGTNLYTYNNCVVQCLMYSVYKFCKCMPYHFTNTTVRRPCNLMDASCLRRAFLSYGHLVLTNSDEAEWEEKLVRRLSENVVRCECLENCDTTLYDIKKTKKVALKMEGDTHSLSNKTMAKVFFNHYASVRRIRSALISWDFFLWYSLFKKKFNRFITNYFKQTSLHGFHYMVDGGGPIKASLWCLVCCVCMGFCFYLIYIQLVRFNTNVTSTSITSIGYPVWENPFPAVTICNNHIVYKNNTRKFTELLKNNGFEDKIIDKFYNQLTTLVMCKNCETGDMQNADMEIYSRIFETLQKDGYNVSRLMMELVASCDVILQRCIWKSQEMPCTEIFKLIKTTNGYCCSFNYYGSKEVQQIKVQEDELRHYTGGSGIPFGLKVFLKFDHDLYLGNIQSNDGFEVVVRDGYDYPDMTMYSNSLLVGDTLTMGLYPSVLRSVKDVEGLRLALRACWFKNEGNLESTNIYSFQSCLTECKAKAIYEICKCVPYNFPLPSASKICTLVDTPCLVENELKFNSLVLTTTLGEDTLKKIGQRVGDAYKCHCYSTCDEVRYETFLEKSHSENDERDNVSILNVFYNSIACTKRTRNVIVTWDMLLAAIGGIFGLCLGGSVLSLVELFYHVADAVFDLEKPNSIENLTVVKPAKTYPSNLEFAIANQVAFRKMIHNNIKGHDFGLRKPPFEFRH